MEWGEALAKTFLAEVEAFGEDVLFNGKTFKASVGESDESKALEMSGYFQNQSLEIIIPHISLVGLTEAPRVNQTIETRGKGYRIDSVRLLADTQGYVLQTELIPQYQSTIQEPTIFIPTAPSEVTAVEGATAPSDVASELLTPLKPSEVHAQNEVELYLIAGQSNAHGHSLIADLETDRTSDISIGFQSSWHDNTSNASTTLHTSPYSSVMELGKTRGDSNETTLESTLFGIEWGFGKKIEETKPVGTEVGIIKYAVGASTILTHATLSHWDIGETGEAWDGLKQAITNASNALQAVNKIPKWKGLVWYQGESDSGTEPHIYQDALNNLVQAIEAELNVTNLPSVFVAPADANGSDLNVNTAHIELARTEDHYNYIKASDYHDGTYNNVHLSASNMYDAGVAVAEAMSIAEAGNATEQTYEPSTNIQFWLDADRADLVTENHSTHLVETVEARIGDIDILPRSRDANAPEIIHEHNGIAHRDCFTMSHDREYLQTDGLVTMPTSTHDWFVVARPNVINNGQDAIWATEAGRAVTLIPVGGYKYTWYWNNVAVSSAQGTASLDGVLSLFCIRWNFNGSHTSTWFNGTQRDSQRSVGSAPNFTMVDVRHNFMAQYGASNATDGNFCEAIVSTATADRVKIEGYLAHKWGLSNQLPITHPYKYYAPSL